MGLIGHLTFLHSSNTVKLPHHASRPLIEPDQIVKMVTQQLTTVTARWARQTLQYVATSVHSLMQYRTSSTQVKIPVPTYSPSALRKRVTIRRTKQNPGIGSRGDNANVRDADTRRDRYASGVPRHVHHACHAYTRICIYSWHVLMGRQYHRSEHQEMVGSRVM